MAPKKMFSYDKTQPNEGRNRKDTRWNPNESNAKSPGPDAAVAAYISAVCIASNWELQTNHEELITFLVNNEEFAAAAPEMHLVNMTGPNWINSVVRSAASVVVAKLAEIEKERKRIEAIEEAIEAEINSIEEDSSFGMF